MTSDTLIIIAGALLSLGFSYIPGLREWYARLGEGAVDGDGGTLKRLVMLGLLVAVAAGSFALGCLGWAADLGLASFACNQSGALGLVKALVLAIMANQSTFKLSPKI